MDFIQYERICCILFAVCCGILLIVLIKKNREEIVAREMSESFYKTTNITFGNDYNPFRYLKVLLFLLQFYIIIYRLKKIFFNYHKIPILTNFHN